MNRPLRSYDGAVAGVLGGCAVVVFFFVYDLIRLEPFATPVELSWIVVGSGGPLVNLPVAARLITLVVFGARLVVYTLLHFTVFAGLGLGAWAATRRLGLPCNAVTGAVYGLLVCSAVFYASMSLAPGVVAAPSWPPVLVANGLAGAVIGGYLQWRQSGTRIAGD